MVPGLTANAASGRPAGSGHRLVPHTADIGLQAWGETLSQLFREAADGLTEVLVGRLPAAGRETRQLELSAASWEELLVSWLNEVLFLFDTRGFLPARFEILALEPFRLRARLHGERYDSERYPLEHQVKAATYHQLQIEQRRNLWQTTIYLDL